jgi:hypothetical protein
MKAYVAVTGVIFALVSVAHILRVVLEHSDKARQPGFIVLTLLAIALSAWAGRLLWAARRQP